MRKTFLTFVLPVLVFAGRTIPVDSFKALSAEKPSRRAHPGACK